jgi:hypothetical protein
MPFGQKQIETQHNTQHKETKQSFNEQNDFQHTYKDTQYKETQGQ